MITRNIILQNRYYDSVVLMRGSEKIKEEIGAKQVSLMMGTDANKDILRIAGLLTSQGESGSPGDLIIAVAIEDESKMEGMEERIEGILAPKAGSKTEDYHPRSLDGAMEVMPSANLALISIPGEYVDWEGEKAIDRGLHLMIFSDNVSLETEIKLKKKGEEKGLLVMGPDCGTSIIHGAALAFANVVRRGNIGIVAAAGTGIQEVSTLIHKMGGGISHAIGTGGRDLSKEVGGITMKMGIRSLLTDTGTDVLVLVSKPPHPDVEMAIYEVLKGVEKPVIINFLGSNGVEAKKRGFKFAKTLEDAAVMAIEASGGKAHLPEPENMENLIREEVGKLSAGQKYLRGLYSGGTLCNETRIILEDSGLEIFSNVTKNPDFKMKDVFKSKKHSLVDMGDDSFTKGAPHPMIDNTKRKYRIIQEVEDPETAVILMDVVLGYGSNPDPAGELVPAINEAREKVKESGRYLIFVASVCGVDEDPQNAKEQIKKLRDAGVVVLPSNARASRFVADIMKRISV